MTYFAFLGWFVGIPLLVLIGITNLDQRRGKTVPATLRSWPVSFVILAHIMIALIYTTPWDNYLVATRVWWYDPTLVTGFVLGWVPIEEYTFFVVQTLFTGLWLLLLARHFAPPTKSFSDRHHLQRAGTLRIGSTITTGIIWLGALLILANGWASGTYLALELIWALPPIIFQLAFGADILWYYRRLVGWGILLPTIYLAAADTVAISTGTWTIDPVQSTGILIGNLPIEEFIFFLLTNTLVVFGITLVLAQQSQPRTPVRLQRWLAQWQGRSEDSAAVSKPAAGRP